MGYNNTGSYDDDDDDDDGDGDDSRSRDDNMLLMEWITLLRT